MSRKKKPVNNSGIPQHIIESIARCILPDIIAYYEEEGFTYALERVGYQKAQYVPAIEDEIAKLKESLALAEKSLAEAKKCPLKISIEEALKFGLIKEQDFVED